MEDVKKIIIENNEKFDHFSYYLLLIEKIEKNLNTVPDISIESCKSLIEGICKTILISLDNTIVESDISGERYSFVRLYKDAMDKLSAVSSEFEVEFVRGFNNNIRILGEIRTKRGDICHGKMAPKEICSSQKFALLILRFTNSLLIYILEYYFDIVFQKDKIEYEDNQDFNDWLDDLISIPSIIYSKAIFEQDEDSYLEQLKVYESQKEDSSEEVEEVVETEIEEVVEIEIEEVVETEIEKVVETEETIFNKYKFISNSAIQDKLIQFAKEEDIYINELLHIIDTNLFDGREPLSSEISSLLIKKLKLIDRKQKVIVLKEKILKLIKDNFKDSNEQTIRSNT